jgi:1,5-anhydro-D-fructose reductase (1,5-anhydro-D-mannitol-forming)
VDAVLIATPNVCHLADALLALRHGKPVLCEKPMGMNATECGTMIEAARMAGLLLGVAQVYRFATSVLRVRERVAAGDIGRPLFARAELCFAGQTHPRSWMYDRAIAGGGALADVGVHCIDVLRFILQDEITGLQARALQRPNCRDVEAGAALLLQFRGGTLGVVMASSYTPYRTPLEIVGETASLRADPALSLQEPVNLELWRDGKMIETERLLNTGAFTHMLDAFAIAVERKQPFACPGEEGLKNQMIVDAAYKQF